ncbi:hypothetical protein FH972_010222 [Carpinus fangiana]|uniref:Uncharacterized protein n=1 Tax=Carpinus fangiana TaxID=176857 RepID=A0A660KTQ7_9ROSI|nr:hypothetical protein FH972_010222 [Carpinus fangiana]
MQKHERLNVEAFSKMKKLKMLEISNVVNFSPWLSKARDTLEWRGDPLNFMLSNELCVMNWWGYPLESLPTSFQSDNVVELMMHYNFIKKPWDGRKSFNKLKHIDLSQSQNLIETPDFMGVRNLEKLVLVHCTSLSKVHPSIGFLRRLKELDLRDCNVLRDFLMRSAWNLLKTTIKNLPLSFTSLSSLVYLNISDCSRLKKIPKNLSGMECLEVLIANGVAIRKLPSFIVSMKKLKVLNVGGLSSLRKLNLSYCNQLDGVIPNDLSCLSALHSLNLSRNKFTKIPNNVGQLSHLYELFLNDCSWLQVLPKLPLGFKYLHVKNCPSPEMFYNQMEMWTSNEKLRSIDCSFVAAYIDYDGKPFKIVHMHPQSPLWINSNSHSFFYSIIVACGPALVGYEIPEWFTHKSRNLFGRIQMHTDLGSDEWKGCARFIVYQVHEPHTYPKKRRKLKVNENRNSNSTTLDSGNPNFPYFVCQFQANEVDLGKPLVLCDPGAPSVGPNGFWVYIP